MRIYRPESTRRIPPGAKVDEKTRTVTYRGRGGERVKAVLTDSRKMRVTQSRWHISFRDALDREQDIAVFEDGGDSRILAKHIEEMVVYFHKPFPSYLQSYCDHLKPSIACALQECGLLEPRAASKSEKLVEWFRNLRDG